MCAHMYMGASEEQKGRFLWCRVMGCGKPTDENVRSCLEEQQVLLTVGPSL